MLQFCCNRIGDGGVYPLQMKPPIATLLSAAAAALACVVTPNATAAGSFQEMSEHLDLDGSFVGYVDFDGDGQVIGDKLSALYQSVSAANPEVPPIPLDFAAIFETLGFGSMRALGLSSTEVGDGLHRNRSVTLLEGEPAGVLALYGLDPIAFRAAEWAPAEATTVVSGALNFIALRDTAVSIMSQVMGPTGEGMVKQGLSQPIPGTEVTVDEALVALSGGIDFIMSQNLENPQQPEIKGWLSLKGAGALLPRLQPLFDSMGIQFVDTEEGRVADLSMLMPEAPIGLLIADPADSDDLVLYTDADWVAGFRDGGARLADTDSFRRVVSRLPGEAGLYVYSAGVDLEPLFGALAQNPEAAPYLPVIREGVDLLLGGLLAPNAAATYRQGDALITEGYAEFSYKGLFFGLPAGVAGVGAGVAAQQAAAQHSGDGADEESGETESEEPWGDVDEE